MQNIQSLLRMRKNEGKKSNVALSMCLIRPKNSKQKISNNIEEMRFYHEIHNYQVKQKLLQETIKKMIKSYNKCIEMSKQSSQPKSNYFEDIKLVVARTVDEAFGLQDRMDEEQIEEAEESTVPMLGVGDIRVWDKWSPDEEVLKPIAEKLLTVHGRFRAETHRLAADRQRLRWLITQPASQTGSPVDERVRALDGDLQATGVPTVAVFHKRDLVETMERVRDALSANRGHKTPVTVHSCSGRRLHGMLANQEVHELRTRLTVVKDKLRATEKDKRDLISIVERSRSDPTTVESLRAVVSKEKKKNALLQSIVDDIFIVLRKDK